MWNSSLTNQPVLNRFFRLVFTSVSIISHKGVVWLGVVSERYLMKPNSSCYGKQTFFYSDIIFFSSFVVLNNNKFVWVWMKNHIWSGPNIFIFTRTYSLMISFVQMYMTLVVHPSPFSLLQILVSFVLFSCILMLQIYMKRRKELVVIQMW